MQPDAEWWVRAGERDLAMAVDLERLQYHEGAVELLETTARFGLTLRDHW